MTRDKWISVIKGAGIAAAGAFVAVLADQATNGAFGSWSPVVGALASVLVNLMRKIAGPVA